MKKRVRFYVKRYFLIMFYNTLERNIVVGLIIVISKLLLGWVRNLNYGLLACK